MNDHQRHRHLDVHILRDLFCAIFCDCADYMRPSARIRIRFGAYSIGFLGEEFDMQVPDSGGPFTADITDFVDAKGNPVTDADTPVWASSDETIATVAVGDPTKPQEATVTLTGTLGQAQVTATFGDPAAGGFVVTGALEVIAGPAVSASMTFTGPGI